MDYEEKLEVVRWLQKHNDDMVLTGSLMLKLRGVDLGREQGDIDLLVHIADVEDKDNLILPPNIKVEEDPNISEGYNVLKRFWYRGVKFECIIAKDNDELSREAKDDIKGVYCAQIDKLLEAKRNYVVSDTNEQSRKKHLKDIECIERYLATKK